MRVYVCSAERHTTGAMRTAVSEGLTATNADWYVRWRRICMHAFSGRACTAGSTQAHGMIENITAMAKVESCAKQSLVHEHCILVILADLLG